MQRLLGIALFGSFVATVLYVHHHEVVERERNEQFLLQLARLGGRPLVQPVLAEQTTPSAATAIDPETVEAIARRVAELLRPSGAAAATVHAAPPSEPTPEARAAFVSARTLLEAAVSRGRLNPDDVRAMRERLADASSEDAEELRRQIAVAINLGKVKPEDPRFVFP